VIAVEVETGKSEILANLLKCVNAGIKKIIFAATTKDALKKTKSQLKKTNRHTGIITVEARYFSLKAGHL
jgi:hypothetical protein